MAAAALYLRSSKDRNDVSIDSQRRELLTLAQARQMPVVKEYVDAVESGKNEHRPGFQALLRDIRAAGRPWDHLLLVDTSRLSRRRYIAQAFKHEARKRGVTVLYAKVPETDPITAVILDAVFEAMDEVHSLMSREKGLAGMRENVRRGFRAGGRAPIGYVLHQVETDVIREGQPVTKTVLQPSEQAMVVARYLKARAAGVARPRAAEGLALAKGKTSLNAIDWNALVYAGHTTWNRHAEHEAGGYRGGVKLRPRSEWVIQRDTHPALISDDEAEAILAQLERGRQPRRTPARFLFTGLLQTPLAEAWHGDHSRGVRRYRYKPAQGSSVTILADDLEDAILRQLTQDLVSEGFVGELVRAAHQVQAPPDTTRLAGKQLARVEQRIRRMMQLAAEMADAAPALREVEALERQRAELREQVAAAEDARHVADLNRTITEADVRRILEGLAADVAAAGREQLKDLLGVLLERISLDPATFACTMHYRVGGVAWDKLASPRGRAPGPRVERGVAVSTRRRRVSAA